MAFSPVSIANMALGEVPHTTIVSFEERSLAAATCKEHYPHALAELLEAHDWEFATGRAILATVINDRVGEWGYAYALPSDMARPRCVLPTFSTAILSYWSAANLAIPYLIADAVLYTSQSGAVLEYSRNDVTEASFPASFARALSFDLATRIVMPILKDAKRQGELINAAETQKQRAIAFDMNRSPTPEPDYVPESIRVRAGWDC